LSQDRVNNEVGHEGRHRIRNPLQRRMRGRLSIEAQNRGLCLRGGDLGEGIMGVPRTDIQCCSILGMGERTPRPKLIGVIACIACRQMARPCHTGALDGSTGAEGRDQRIPACRGMRASSGGFTCALNRWIPAATSPLKGGFISAVLGHPEKATGKTKTSIFGRHFILSIPGRYGTLRRPRFRRHSQGFDRL